MHAAFIQFLGERIQKRPKDLGICYPVVSKEPRRCRYPILRVAQPTEGMSHMSFVFVKPTAWLCTYAFLHIHSMSRTAIEPTKKYQARKRCRAVIEPTE